MNQKVIDGIARTFYVALAIGGCLASAGFVLLGTWSAVFVSTWKGRLFFAALAVMGVGVGITSFYFLKYVCTHNDLPPDDLGTNPNVQSHTRAQ